MRVVREHVKAGTSGCKENYISLHRRIISPCNGFLHCIYQGKRNNPIEGCRQEILRLTQAYGAEAAAEALERVSRYGNYSSYAVRRILKERFPLIPFDLPEELESSGGSRHHELEDVDTGSFEDYDEYTAGAAEGESDQNAARAGEGQQ